MWRVDPDILDSAAVRDTLRALSDRRLVQRVTTTEPSEFRGCSLRKHNVASALTAPSARLEGMMAG